ncbi:MAG: glycosyltransferase family 2 protein [Planctomycetaceae bacterium]|jgi:glycosyltransferase involved in cell wall biosynthesis|nr:glycosyltransferase family 2 protein [Planctomycetaceae bacterium]
MTKTFISVIIPVRNEAAHIGQVLDALLRQRYPSELFEILVIDGCSTDNTRELVTAYQQRHAQVRLFGNPKRLSSAARNIGIDNFRGDIFLLIDGHCLIDNDNLFGVIDRAFQDETIDCLGRPQPLELRNANAIQLAIAAARRSPLGHHPDSFIYANKPCIAPAISIAVAYRRCVFERVGRFDETFDAAEDAEFNYRCDKAEQRCLFEPESAIRYVPRKTISGLFRQLVRYGRGRIKLTRKHPETFSLKSTLPAFFVAGVTIGIIPAMLSWIFCGLYLTVLLLYAAIILAETIRQAIQNRNWTFIFLLPVIFTTIYISSGTGLLAEVFFGRKRTE